ncbi:MAG: glycosyltransferase family 2 protein [Litorilinea sp.]
MNIGLEGEHKELVDAVDANLPVYSRRLPVATLVVLNYNGGAHMVPLVEHLAAQTVRDFELVLVDNASHDGSTTQAETLARARGLDIQVIHNTRNRGFAPACNQGSRAAAAPNLVMLNNDTRPYADWLERLLGGLEQARRGGDRQVGMIASKLLRAHRPAQIDSAGIALDWAGIAWDWQGGALDDPADNTPRPIFGPCGGAALYDRAMFETLGGFDDDFFAYMEDVDLAWRARLAGYGCLLQPDARVLHAHSATLGDGSPFKRYLLARNKMWTIIKNYPNPWFAGLLPVMLGYDGLAAGYGLLRRRDLASVRGRLAGLAHSAPMWRKRQAIQRQWRAVDNWRAQVAPLDLPWDVPKRYAHLADGTQ